MKRRHVLNDADVPLPDRFPFADVLFSPIRNASGYGAAWLARSSGGREVAGSNPASPTKRTELQSATSPEGGGLRGGSPESPC